MRHNGHLLQTNKGVADIGSPATVADPSAKDISWFKMSSSSPGVPIDRTVTSDMISYLNSETRYRNIYSDRIFLGNKKTDGSYKINDFFTLPLPKENEVLTTGQTADYMLNPSNGLFPVWVGDHFGETSIRGLWVSGAPSQNDWNYLSLYNKMKLVLDGLIGAVGTGGLFNVKAKAISADTFQGEGAFNATATGNLNAGGHGSPIGDFILSITNGSTGDSRKKITINRQVNGTTPNWYPSGIAGTYYSGESYANYGAGDFSFVDVGRYYLRSNTEQGNNVLGVGKSYIQATTIDGGGVLFQMGDRNVTIPYPSSIGAKVVTTSPTSPTIINVDNSSLIVSHSNTSPGFCIRNIIHDNWFTTIGDKSLKLWGAGESEVGILLKYISNPTYAAEYHFLTSEAGETMYGGNPGTNTYIPFLNFKYQSDADKNVSIGMIGSAYGSKFYIRQRTSSVDYFCKTPDMLSDSTFIISDALIPGSGTQSINTALSCSGVISTAGGIKAGSGSPTILFKSISNTTSDPDEASKTIAHGLNFSKILSCSVMLELSTTGQYHLPGTYYDVRIYDTNILLVKTTVYSIGNKKYRILITYEP